MVELRLEISDDLKRKMSELSVNWNSAIIAFIADKVSEWQRLRSITSKSKLTGKDALELGRKINEGLSQRYKELISHK